MLFPLFVVGFRLFRLLFLFFFLKPKACIVRSVCQPFEVRTLLMNLLSLLGNVVPILIVFKVFMQRTGQFHVARAKV